MSGDLDEISTEALGEITSIGAEFLAALLTVWALALPALMF